MHIAPTHRREERGLAAVEALSVLLSRQRADGPLAGIFDAADVQWWWKDEGRPDRPPLRVRTWLWSDGAGADVAWLRTDERGAPGEAGGRADVALGWLATAGEETVAAVLDALAAIPASPARPLHLVSDERDAALTDRLSALGFERAPAEDMVQMWQRPAAPPDGPALPPGFRFDDDRFRPAGRPHHLARRNGPGVADRLREVSLYRPDLDLLIRETGSGADGDAAAGADAAADGPAAAYCLGWLDTANGVGTFEPVRTEDAYQRRGLGRALLAEGARRMMAGGATVLRVAREADNPASAALYRRAGFEDGSRNLGWRRTG